MSFMSVPDRSPAGRRVCVRTCVGCRERAAKSELLRVVAGDRGAGPELVPDPAGRAPGRGAHLHPTPACLGLALRRRAFARALRIQGSGSSLATSALEDFVQAQDSGDQGGARQRPGSNENTTRNWSSSS